MKRIITAIILCVMAVFTLSSCKSNEDPVDKLPNDIVIELNDGQIIKAELYPDIAPITVRNFKKLMWMQEVWQSMLQHLWQIVSA